MKTSALPSTRQLQMRSSGIHAKLLERLNQSNVEQLNDDCWPFQIPFQFVNGLGRKSNIVLPEKSLVTYMAVSADAAFVMTRMVASVYVSDDLENKPWSYVNQANPQGNQNANGLTFQWADSSSTRQFTRGPTPIEVLGSGPFPFNLAQPMLVWPSARLELKASNANLETDENPINYLVKVTAIGYRVRIPREMLEKTL